MDECKTLPAGSLTVHTGAPLAAPIATPPTEADTWTATPAVDAWKYTCQKSH